MGNRASISFKQGGETSPVLCDHWGGDEMFTYASNYLWLRCEMNEQEGAINDPLFRLEPMHLMVDFIIWYARECDHRSCYIATEERFVDNSDCGHKEFDVEEFRRRFKDRMKK